jgi:ech hydrogenase subunit A
LSTGLLLFLPFITAFIVPFLDQKRRDKAVIAFVSVISGLSVLGFFTQGNTSFDLSHSLHTFFFLLDIGLLLYFALQGLKYRDKPVLFLALFQLVLYSAVHEASYSLKAPDIIADELSFFMFLVINIVGGLIIVYALKYIESEDFSSLKKNVFISILIFFIGVMNFIVCVDNIELFFLFFELTTLCSYLLIRFRGDEVAQENALRALWMNQIGGVAILVGLLFAIHVYDTVSFFLLLQKAEALFLLPVVFIVIAAFVKGASIPFQSWLLGAMVAPTPVSAILHSAAMVKIAPYLILKISPLFTPLLSTLIALFGTFVFAAASASALSKDFFKEILGYSTVALLALMMAFGAINTPESRFVAMMLILFHALSKALLFLQAGILEKEYRIKYVSQMDELIDRAPKTLFFIMIGFASLTLPPFGAFIAKFLAIESIAAQLTHNPFMVFVLVFLALGSVFLTILYFKTVSKLLTKDVFRDLHKEKLSWYYFMPSLLLFLFLIVGIIGVGLKTDFSFYEIVIPLMLMAAVFILLKMINFSQAHRVKEYNCGEKDAFELSCFYYESDAKLQKTITKTAVVFIMMILISGVLG